VFPKPAPWYLSATAENGIALFQVKKITVVGLDSTAQYISFRMKYKVLTAGDGY